MTSQRWGQPADTPVGITSIDSTDYITSNEHRLLADRIMAVGGFQAIDVARLELTDEGWQVWGWTTKGRPKHLGTVQP